ncbi:MAG: dihydrofolate reductase family protein [Magnetovibrio sp.]|nr:dihydrofolate reductase family protein [Magnetovibrio sp.]
MMTTAHAFMGMSLDGFIARQDHSLDWLMKFDTTDEDHGFDAFMDSVDGLVMGANTFKTVLGFDSWPYTKKVVVMTRSLSPQDIPAELQDKVRLSSQSPEELMQQLRDEDWSRAYVDGGQLVQSFIRSGLLADITLTILPTLIGSGVRLFGALDADQDLELMNSQSFGSGFVTNCYKFL